MTKDFDINLELLGQYKLQSNNEAFWQLYENIQYLLKKILRNPFFIYPDKIKKQRYYKFYILDNRYKKRINSIILLEKYRIEFIQQNYMFNYSSNDKNDYSLDLYFADFLDTIKFDKAKEYIQKTDVSCNTYLGIKFCDKYWCFVDKCLRRDFPKIEKRKSKSGKNNQTVKGNFSHINKVQINLDKCSKSSSSSSFVNSILIKETIDEFNKVLNNRDKNILDFIIKGYTYEEICEMLKITNGNLRKRIHLIRDKLYPIHTNNGHRLI